MIADDYDYREDLLRRSDMICMTRGIDDGWMGLALIMDYVMYSIDCLEGN